MITSNYASHGTGSITKVPKAVEESKNIGDDNLSDDERLFYLNDANFNITALVNQSGTVVERYGYDPYGKVTVLDADCSADADGKSNYYNEILCCGYHFDSETYLYHIRRRYYHPTLARWLTRDPLNRDIPGNGYHDGVNLYEYVKSRPIRRLDPKGLYSFFSNRF